MLENGAESHPSAAPTKMRDIIFFYERNRDAIGTVYSEAASTQAEQSSGWRLDATVVSGQIDRRTKGMEEAARNGLTRIALDPKLPRKLASETELLALRPELQHIE